MAQEQMEADIHAHVLFTKPESKHATEFTKPTDPDESLGSELSETESRNPCMQALWEETTCKELEVPYKYQNVAALIIHWAKHLDEGLECKEESEELHQLFQAHFKFKSKILELHNEKPPQRQLRHALDALALEHDGTCRSNLLIVYYSGHGMTIPGQGLYITGEERHDPEKPWRKSKFPPHASWNDAEEVLKESSADILTIIDSCSAGSIWKDGGQEDRSWEVLAASSSERPTAIPGPESFTRALIDCLKARITAQPDELFTVCQLHHDMVKSRKNTGSVYQPRHGINNRYIKLARLDSKIADAAPSRCAEEAASLTLRFSFRDKTALSNDEVRKLAEKMAQGASSAELGINKIDWVEFKRKDPSPVAHFQRLCRGVIIAQRLWRQEKPQSCRKRRQDEDADQQERPQSPKRPRVDSRFTSTQLQVDAFGHISPSPSNKSGRETPDLTL